MDETLKKQFDSLCSDFGMNATTAFNIFAKAVVRERKIPFEIYSPADATRDEAISAFWEMRKIAEENGLYNSGYSVFRISNLLYIGFAYTVILLCHRVIGVIIAPLNLWLAHTIILSNNGIAAFSR